MVECCLSLYPSPFAAGDEYVFAAVVRERLAGESSIERLQAQTRDVDQPEPLVLLRPPERAGPAGIKRKVDPVVARRPPGDPAVLEVRRASTSASD